MESLLSKVLDKKENPSVESVLSPKDDLPHQLPNGSIVYDSTIAAVNRIFALNPDLHKRFTVNGDMQLYNGRDPINIKQQLQLLKLLHGDWTPKTDWQTIFLQEQVIELAPVYSFDCYWVADNLLWDKDEAKLKRINKDSTMEEEDERS